jgi:hypothetical protein
MRALRVVGISESDGDFSVVLEDPGRRERFTVPADEQLRAAARGDLTRLGQIAIELESQLRPREIQARIRAGASVEQVASAAGVPLQKIERFAYPVLLERSRTADVAQRAHPVRADGPDTRTLGDVVAHTFGLRGQEYAEADWDSWKGEDGRWVVALSWRAGRSDNRAHWTFLPGAHGGTVTAIDEHASDLVEGLPARPLRTVGPVIDIARAEEPEPGPAPVEELRAAASDIARGARIEPQRSDGPSRVETPRERPNEPAPEPPAARTEPARPATPRGPERPAARVTAPEPNRTASRPPTEPTEPTAPPPAAEPASARTAADPPAQRPAERRAPEPRRPVPPAQRRAPVEPAREAAPAAEPEREQPAETAEAEPEAAREPTPEPTPPAAPEPPAAANRRTKKGKPVMPSWDEVLLGVRGQR